MIIIRFHTLSVFFHLYLLNSVFNKYKWKNKNSVWRRIIIIYIIYIHTGMEKVKKKKNTFVNFSAFICR